MSDSITVRDLFAAVALHSLMPFVLEQQETAAMQEAMSLAVTSSWTTADAMVQLRNLPSKNNEPEA